MKNFLKDYWPWMVVPMFLVFGALAVLVLFSSGESGSPFVYNLF